MNEFENLRRLLIEDRSIRRFDQSRRVARETLDSLVELTRYCASGRNLQPLRYFIVDSEEGCGRVFPLLAWAGYLEDWPGPEPGERPAAYLVQCLDTRLGKDCLCDDGLQLQAITLGARALGLGGCIIKAFNGPKLREVLGLGEEYAPRYVLALGCPAETVELEDMAGDFKYYRTAAGVHHVPKRVAGELVIGTL